MHQTLPSSFLLLGLSIVVCSCGEDPPSMQASGGEAGTGARFSATVIDSTAAVTTPVGGLTIKVVDNQTCEPSALSAVSDSDGRFSFRDLTGDADGRVAFLVLGRAPDYIDTWSYNVARDMQDETLRAVPLLSAQLTPGLAQFKEDDAQGPVAGGVFVGTDSKNRTPVGCLTVRVDGHETNETIRYFSGNLPEVGLTQTHPDNGRFFVGNLPPGRHVIRAFRGEEALGSTSLCVKARSSSTTGENVSLVAIYLDANPTPGCK